MFEIAKKYVMEHFNMFVSVCIWLLGNPKMKPKTRTNILKSPEARPSKRQGL